MKQFLTVLRFEIDNYFKNKSFIITTLILVLVLCGVIMIPVFIPGLIENEEKVITEYSAPEENTVLSSKVGIVGNLEDENVKLFIENIKDTCKLYSDENELKKDVQDEKIEAGFILDSIGKIQYVVKDKSLQDMRSVLFRDGLTNWQKQNYYLEKGLTPEEIIEGESFRVEVENVVLGKDSASNFGYTYILVFAIYFLIIFYGQMIAVSITNEKSNRAIEILVTSVDPNSLIFGKVIAGALAGILQMTIILGSGILSYTLVKDRWGGRLDLIFDIPAEIWIAYIILGLLSYLLYSFIFGALGALVSKTEDISKSATPITLIYIVSFLISMMGLSNSDSLWMKIVSFIPFTSGNAMFIRISMGSTQIWEIVLSVGILAVSCAVAGVLAAKLFRFGTLHYGNPIKLRNALKHIKDQ